jgi:NAD(P)-dependent dehydrogenase (short-subunit alcohol dehydrogenase family)
MVTGCSTGIGAATARVLRERGWQVWPTARKEADLESLARDGFTPVSLDLRNSDSVRAAAEKVLSESGGQLGALVNNAGFAQPGAVEDLSREALRDQFEVNFFGLQELTNALIPAFRKQGFGRIVNVSSVLGRIATPMVGAYCASKFALEALSDALRVELKDTGIGVILIEPGPIVSAFRRSAAARAAEELDMEGSRFGEAYAKEVERRSRQKKTPDFFTKPPEAVAGCIHAALMSRHPRRRYCITFAAHAGAWARRFAPAWFIDRMLAKQVPSGGTT